MAPITHIVAFGFKDDISAEVIKETIAGALGLQQSCVHPSTQQPYILSIKGGKDKSPEGLQNGVTHAFIVEFASEEDRDYYLKKDPAHLAYAKTLSSLISSITVTDFTTGVY